MKQSSSGIPGTRVGILAILAGALAPGCGDGGVIDGEPLRHWTRAETSVSHGLQRRDEASETQRRAVAGSDSRGSAIRAAIVARTDVVPSLSPVPGDPWQVRALGLIHSSEVGSGSSASVEGLRAMLGEPAVAADPRATAIIRVALGCAILRDSRRRAAAGDEAIAALDEAIGLFASVCQIPEGPINEAACLLERAAIRPNEAGECIARARAALLRLESDAVVCPSRQGEFLGSILDGPRIVFVVDVGGHPASSVRIAVRDAVVEAIRSLPQGSSFGVVAVRGQPSEMPVPPGSEARDGLVARQGSRDDRVIAQAARWLDDVLSAPEAGLPEPSVLGESLAAAARLGPSTVALVTDRVGAVDMAMSFSASTRFSEAGIRTAAFLIPRDGPLSDGELESVGSGWLGALVPLDGGFLRAFPSPRPDLTAALTGDSIRARAMREGVWSSEVARHFAAVSGQLLLMVGRAEGESRAEAVDELSRALRPLTPDPLTPLPGPGRADWTLLMLEGCARDAAGERGASDSFDAAAVALADAASAAIAAGRPAEADALSERGCRALLLGAVCQPAGGRADAAARALDRAESLGIARGGWSARLLSAGLGASRAERASVGLDSRIPGHAACLAELEAVAFLLGDGPQPVSAGPIPGIPILEADVFARAIGRTTTAPNIR